jgi:hypothetical protein
VTKPSEPAVPAQKQAKPAASKPQTASAAKRATQLQKEQQKQQAEAEEARKAGTVFYLTQTAKLNMPADIRKRNRELLDKEQEADESDLDSPRTQSSHKRSKPSSSVARSSTQQPDEDADIVPDSEPHAGEQDADDVGHGNELDDDETAFAAGLNDFNHSRKPIFLTLIYSDMLDTDEPDDEHSTSEDIPMEHNGVRHLVYLNMLQLYILT